RQRQTPGREDGLMATDIHLTAEDLRIFVDLMAVIYNHEIAAFQVLDQIGFPRSRRPVFNEVRAPIEVWSEIFGEFSQGIIHTPYRDLLTVALRSYPGNRD